MAGWPHRTALTAYCGFDATDIYKDIGQGNGWGFRIRVCNDVLGSCEWEQV